MDFLKRRSLGQGTAAWATQQLRSNPGAALQSLPVSPWALGMEAQEALSPGGSSRDPLRKEAGCLGPGERVCVRVVCVHENWHMCTCVAVSRCDAEGERT